MSPAERQASILVRDIRLNDFFFIHGAPVSW